MTSVTESVFSATPGTQVKLETTTYEWSNPLPVIDVDDHRFEAPFGDDFTARRVELEGGHGASYRVDVIEGAGSLPELIATSTGDDRGIVMTFEPSPAPRELSSNLTPAVTRCVPSPRRVEWDELTPAVTPSTGPETPSESPTPRTVDWEELDSAISQREPESDDPDEAVPWLARPASEIVEAQNDLRRDLDEVLWEVERQSSVLDISQRLGLSLTRAKSLLWELGLLKENGELLLPDEELQNRVDTIREVEM